jgi:DNA polymerase III gamma/tau subunit
VTRQAQRISQAAVIRALRTFSEALSLARTGGNARLELETALLRFIMTSDEPSVDLLAARVAALEERAASAPASAAPKAAAEKNPAPKNTPALSVQRVKAAWQSIRGKVEGERQSLSAPLSRAVIEAVDGNALVLKLPNSWSAETLREHAALIEAAIADVLGKPLKLTLRIDGSASRARAREEEDPDVLFDYANERIPG